MKHERVQDVVTIDVMADHNPRSLLARCIQGTVVLFLCLVVPLAIASPAFAYNGAAAAQYADQYATSPNSGSYPVFSDDCTNFVSQAVHAGGYSFVGGSSSTSDYRWWLHTDFWTWYGYSWSNSWSVANDYNNFLTWTAPGVIL
jgi:hypothetical protein